MKHEDFEDDRTLEELAYKVDQAIAGSSIRPLRGNLKDHKDGRVLTFRLSERDHNALNKYISSGKDPRLDYNKSAFCRDAIVGALIEGMAMFGTKGSDTLPHYQHALAIQEFHDQVKQLNDQSLFLANVKDIAYAYRHDPESLHLLWLKAQQFYVYATSDIVRAQLEEIFPGIGVSTIG